MWKVYLHLETMLWVVAAAHYNVTCYNIVAPHYTIKRQKHTQHCSNHPWRRNEEEGLEIDNNNLIQDHRPLHSSVMIGQISL